MRGRILSAAALAAGIGLASAASAQAAPAELGTRSLAEVLLADGDQFDGNWYDYDIVTEAVLAVLKAKPSSPVAVLTHGDTALTAFLPNDRAFQVLAHDLTNKRIDTEQGVFQALVGAVGVDAIEAVLLYHVVPGATLDAATALKSDGVRLNTALPGTSFKVDVISRRYKIVRLVDNDPNDINPYLNPRGLDINKGNRQIAHGILFVLRPVNL
ncbi:MAG: fasciclin domain-containing protein [Dermatophilaceae bacterium]